MNLLNQSENQAQIPPRQKILQMSMGFMISQCIYVAAKLGIADLLKDGPKHCHDLAAATDTDSDSLYRLLRTLAGVGVFLETKPGCFQLTPLASCLQSQSADTVRDFIIIRGEQQYPCWGNLMYSLQTGQNVFEHTYGMDRYQYAKQNPGIAEVDVPTLTKLSAGDDAAVVAAYDFSTLEKLVDIGGGQGSLLAAILRRHPTLKGVLFEQPYVIEPARRLLKKEGVMDRCELVSGDFFESVPPGADIYLLKHVLHNWDDQKAIKILQNCHRAMAHRTRAGKGRLLVIERLILPGNDFSMSKFTDLNMLVMHSGRERTEAEFGELFKIAGFKLTKIVPTEAKACIIIEGLRD